jgi:hypothetical protein
VAVGFGVVVAAQHAAAGARRTVGRVAVFCAGGGVALLLVALPYLATNSLRIFFEGAFVLPLVHAEGNLGFTPAAVEVLRNIGGIQFGIDTRRPELWLAPLVWLPASLTLGIMVVRPQFATAHLSLPYMRGVLGLLLVTVLSIVMSGIPWPHHLLQALPLVCLVASVGMMAVMRLRHAWLVWAVASLFLAGSLQSVAREYPVFARRARAGVFMTGRAGQIAEYIGARCAAPCRIFMVSDHIVYWLLKAPLPTRVVQPSNLFTPGFYFQMSGVAASPELEVQRILESRPEFIVVPSQGGASTEGILAVVKARYALVASIEDRRIYRLQ